MFLDNFSLSLKASEAKSLACKLHFQFSNVEGQCEAMLGVTKNLFSEIKFIIQIPLKVSKIIFL
jgi:hypothetical protein